MLSSVDMRYRSNRRILLGHSSEVLKLKREGGAIVFDAILVFFSFFGKRFLCARIPLRTPCNIK